MKTRACRRSADDATRHHEHEQPRRRRTRSARRVPQAAADLAHVVAAERHQQQIGADAHERRRVEHDLARDEDVQRPLRIAAHGDRDQRHRERDERCRAHSTRPPRCRAAARPANTGTGRRRTARRRRRRSTCSESRAGLRWNCDRSAPAGPAPERERQSGARQQQCRRQNRARREASSAASTGGASSASTQRDARQ